MAEHVRYVIAKIAGGFANQVENYITGQIVAMRFKAELILDISSCLYSYDGYTLDEFAIPNCVKVISAESGHKGFGRICEYDDGIREEDTVHFNDREKLIRFLKRPGNLLPQKICLEGFFPCFYQLYPNEWRVIRKSIKLKEESPFTECMKRLIDNYQMVAVHIRKGSDKRYRGYAQQVEADYYRAAIVLFKIMIPNCRFLIITDDLEYAKSILARDSKYYYVHCIGNLDADIQEFICMSRCRYIIMSPSSSFSLFAFELNSSKYKIGINQSVGKKDFHWYCNAYKQYKKDEPEGKMICVDERAIRFLSKKYKVNNKNADLSMVEDEKSNLIMDEIDAVNLTSNKIKRLMTMKFKAAMPQNGKTSLLYANILWTRYEKNINFHKRFMELLILYKCFYEALIEKIRYEELSGEQLKILLDMSDLEKNLTTKLKYHFVIVPYVPTHAQTGLYDLGAVGYVLRRLGHKVTFVFKPIEPLMGEYLDKFKYITGRGGFDTGCYQCNFDSISNVSNLIAEEDNGILISRDIRLWDLKGFRYQIYVPPIDRNDADKNKIPQEDEQRLLATADFICNTTNLNDTYEVLHERFEISRIQRMNPGDVVVAGEILKFLD